MKNCVLKLVKYDIELIEYFGKKELPTNLLSRFKNCLTYLLRNNINGIRNCLLKMENGNFTINMLNNAKKDYLNALKNAFNYNENYISYYYGIENLHSDDINTRRENIKKITKEDIINISKMIKIDTMYFLEGEL